jgi:hypothetical protein
MCIMPFNNTAECALRGVALGRKAWLFASSERGGDRAACVFSLVVTEGSTTPTLGSGSPTTSAASPIPQGQGSRPAAVELGAIPADGHGGAAVVFAGAILSRRAEAVPPTERVVVSLRPIAACVAEAQRRWSAAASLPPRASHQASRPGRRRAISQATAPRMAAAIMTSASALTAGVRPVRTLVAMNTVSGVSKPRTKSVVL